MVKLPISVQVVAALLVKLQKMKVASVHSGYVYPLHSFDSCPTGLMADAEDSDIICVVDQLALEYNACRNSMWQVAARSWGSHHGRLVEAFRIVPTF